MFSPHVSLQRKKYRKYTEKIFKILKGFLYKIARGSGEYVPMLPSLLYVNCDFSDILEHLSLYWRLGVIQLGSN